MNRPRLLMIVGAGRSGSTLLDLLLGSQPDTVSAGELRFFWERGLLDSQRCGCGAPIPECAFWKEVLYAAGQSGESAAARAALSNRVDRLRYFVAGVFRPLFPQTMRRAEEYVRAEGNVVSAISRVSHRHTIVDSSKYPARALTFSLNPEWRERVYIIHLVRDPRAVAHSWTRKKQRLEIPQKVEYMPRYSVWHSALLWIALNIASTIISLLVPSRHYVRVQYEQLARDPTATLKRIGSMLGDVDMFSGVLGQDNSAHIHHTVSGNPIRFSFTQQRQIALDESWRENMPRIQKVIVLALTLPAMWFYGYRLRDVAGA